MRYTASYDSTLGETRIELASNCYTDAFPMLKRILFRKQDIDLHSQSLPLAAAILTSAYCGDQFEFVGLKIGSDYADAIRHILPGEVSIANVDGMHRTISTGEVDVIAECAVEANVYSETMRLNDPTPLSRIDWSGDFVNRPQRNSGGFAFGAFQTNAEFFASRTLVSVAIGLLHARDKARNLYVPVKSPAELRTLEPLQRALRIVGVSLQLVPPAFKPTIGLDAPEAALQQKADLSRVIEVQG